MPKNMIVDATQKNPTIQTQNTFTIVGSAIRKYRINNGTISLTVAVRRPGDSIVNYPQIIFYGKEAADAIDAMDISNDAKPRVEIRGMVQTRKKVRQDGHTDYFQSFVGHSLELTQTTMESLTGISNVGRRKAQGQNEFTFVGSVFHTYEAKDKQDPSRRVCVVLSLFTKDNGGVNFPNIVCFGRSANVAANLKDGDYVCVVGYASTRSKRNENGKYEYRESVIADEVYKLSQEELQAITK